MEKVQQMFAEGEENRCLMGSIASVHSRTGEKRHEDKLIVSMVANEVATWC